MAILKNSRREAFCQFVAQGGMTIGEAYVKAGFKENDANAAHMRQVLNERITELKQDGAKRVSVSVASLVAELDDVLALAHRVDAPGAAVQAIMAKGKLAGLITDKQQVTVETVTNDMELARWITARLDDAKPELTSAIEPPPTPQRH